MLIKKLHRSKIGAVFSVKKLAQFGKAGDLVLIQKIIQVEVIQIQLRLDDPYNVVDLFVGKVNSQDFFYGLGGISVKFGFELVIVFHYLDKSFGNVLDVVHNTAPYIYLRIPYLYYTTFREKYHNKLYRFKADHYFEQVAVDGQLKAALTGFNIAFCNSKTQSAAFGTSGFVPADEAAYYLLRVKVHVIG